MPAMKPGAEPFSKDQQGGGAQTGGDAAEPKAGGATPGQSGENVVDADFEVVDDDKKKN